MNITYYRFKYTRKNLISIPLILYPLLLVYNLIIFNWFILFFSITIFLISLYIFIKHVLPLITDRIVIQKSGIEWIRNNKQKAMFSWDDFIDINEYKFIATTSFNLYLNEKWKNELNLNAFRFDYDAEILYSLKINCANQLLRSKLKSIGMNFPSRGIQQ